MAGAMEDTMLIFYSRDGGNLHDTFPHLSEIELEHKPFWLKLNSSEGLDSSSEPEEHRSNLRLVYTLNTAIE